MLYYVHNWLFWHYFHDYFSKLFITLLCSLTNLSRTSHQDLWDLLPRNKSISFSILQAIPPPCWVKWYKSVLQVENKIDLDFSGYGMWLGFTITKRNIYSNVSTSTETKSTWTIVQLVYLFCLTNVLFTKTWLIIAVMRCSMDILRTQSGRLPDGFIAHFVEHCTGIAEVMDSNPVQAWIFFQVLVSQLFELYA